MRMKVLTTKWRVEIENETRVFLETLDFEIEMRVLQKSADKARLRALEGHCASLKSHQRV